MIKKLNLNQSIYDMMKAEEDIEPIMLELGFKDIVKPGMLGSVGKFMTLEKGARMKGISWQLIEETFQKYGYAFVKED